MLRMYRNIDMVSANIAAQKVYAVIVETISHKRTRIERQMDEVRSNIN